ncbi:glycerate kinase [Sphingomonas naphthae]|uniref:Glycerate kinase n=1 Tax=Sphingomonas naphthae TaxID=1813468 RepID=A0ABY7TLW1_9SPHN|nr:glycerate kinase [Sphingomonas naphthae]WCT74149.1 glycerate kinase [Sphingomonas naphthae]
MIFDAPRAWPRITTPDQARAGLLREMFSVALDAVSAERCVPPFLPSAPAGKTLILGIGKAGAAMARVAAREMPGRTDGIVLTRYGHSYRAEDMPPGMIVFEAGHPLPDEHGLQATRAILAAVQALGPDDQLLALISGGASALLTMPANGITLADKKAVTRELLLCGASISEINCVRTHLSEIKGGRLAIAAAPARVVTLAFSDIPGDNPALIGSGPTVSDRTRLSDARHILDRYRIDASDAVRAALLDPANETPTAQSDALPRLETKVIACSRNAQQAAGQLATAHGYTPVYLGDIEGDAAETGIVHAALALHHHAKGGRWALLSGGETTVVVHNPEGQGGRNGEYLLSLAIALGGQPGISALACDTDGIDGTEDNAGAVIDATTLARAARKGLEPTRALRENRSYGFFSALGDLVTVGPTRTNVNDLRIILVDAETPHQGIA